MTEAMTPPTMVTDAQCEEWRKYYEDLQKDGSRVAPPVVLALLADRERYREFVTWASAEWPKHMSAEQVLAQIRTKARILKEVGRGH